MRNVRRLAASLAASLGLLVVLGNTGSAQQLPESTVSPAAPVKNLRPVTPDMLPGLLKKVPANKVGALPPRPAGVAPAVIPPGPYLVQTQHNYKCLDANPLPPDTDGSQVYMWDCHGGRNQQWLFHHLNSNNYLIANVYHGRILDADTNTICCNGTKVQLWRHIPGNLNQTWWLWTDGLGLYIQNNHPTANRRVLDADLWTIGRNGGKVQLWDFNGNNNQSWAGPPRP